MRTETDKKIILLLIILGSVLVGIGASEGLFFTLFGFGLLIVGLSFYYLLVKA